MGNLIVVGVIVLIISGSIAKIVSEKRKGVKCVGCPSSGGQPLKKKDCCCNSDAFPIVNK